MAQRRRQIAQVLRGIGKRSSLARRLRFESLEDRRQLSISVTTLADEVDGVGVGTGTSLREAIAAAAPGDEITFEVAGTINLTIGATNSTKHLVIDKDLTITGPGAQLLTIKGFDPDADGMNDGDGSRVFLISDENSNALVDVEITGLTIINGDSSGSGGGIHCSENLTLTNCVVSGNSSQVEGGGIFHRLGNLSVANTSISGNVSTGTFAIGGGILADGNLTLTHSTVSVNSATLQGGGILVTGDVTLTSSTVNGNSTTGNLSSGGGIWAIGDVTLSDSTVSGNSTTAFNDDGGGGILAHGDVTLTNSTVSGNTANQGGGISARHVSLTNSTVSENEAVGSGGGILATGNVTLTSSTVSGNEALGSGGGICATSHNVAAILTSSTISGNEAHSGGGIFADCDLTLTNSTVSENVATGTYASGGGFLARSNVTLTNSTISGNSASGNGAGGGGLAATAYGGVAVTLTNSTINGNSTTGNNASGGGIWVYGDVTLTNSTISGNSTSGTNASGGGIWAYGDVTLANSTVSGNTATRRGGGVFSYEGLFYYYGAITVENSILAGNTAANTPDLRPGTGTVSVDYSLIGTGITPTDGGNNIVSDAPQLAPLADNGGPTKTRALLADSPAIDAGDPNFDPADPDGDPLTDDALPYDQRGGPFARVFDGDGMDGQRVDIGAVEFIPDDAVHVMFGDYNRDGRVNAADYVVWRNSSGAMNVSHYSSADGNGDGQIDRHDYLKWKQFYGETVPELGFATASGATVISLSSVQALGVAPAETKSALAVDEEFDRPLSLPGTGSSLHEAVASATTNFADRGDQPMAEPAPARRTQRRSAIALSARLRDEALLRLFDPTRNFGQSWREDDSKAGVSADDKNAHRDPLDLPLEATLEALAAWPA